MKSFINNASKGNVGAAIVDGVGVLADGVALAVPLVPGGAGAIIKVVRGGDKVIDMAKGADNSSDLVKSGQKLLPEKAGSVGHISPTEVKRKTPSQIDTRAKEIGLEPIR